MTLTQFLTGMVWTAAITAIIIGVAPLINNAVNRWRRPTGVIGTAKDIDSVIARANARLAAKAAAKASRRPKD